MQRLRDKNGVKVWGEHREYIMSSQESTTAPLEVLEGQWIVSAAMRPGQVEGNNISGT